MHRMQTKRIVQVWFAGLLVVVPFAITAYVFWRLATWLGGMGYYLMMELLPLYDKGLADAVEEAHRRAVANGDMDGFSVILAIVGSLLVILAIYFIGLLTHWWIFRKVLNIVEIWISRVPGVKTIYESVRDLMKLFGGDSSKMGRAVLYNIPQTDINVLGILTNDSPVGVSQNGKRMVAVYLPFSYMFGGPTIYVSPDQVREAGISVDQALKLCATAHVGSPAPAAPLPEVIEVKKEPISRPERA